MPTIKKIERGNIRATNDKLQKVVIVANLLGRI